MTAECPRLREVKLGRGSLSEKSRVMETEVTLDSWEKIVPWEEHIPELSLLLRRMCIRLE